MKNAEYWIRSLLLAGHPEGGYFREVYRSDDRVSIDSTRYPDSRVVSTSIYYLLEGHDYSAFHRLKSDEVWHFYEGDPVRIYLINEIGNLKEEVLGRDPDSGHLLQLVIPHNTWFAACSSEEKGFSLVGCQVSPGFEFEDFELADRAKLIVMFPDLKDLIIRFTRDKL